MCGILITLVWHIFSGLLFTFLCFSDTTDSFGFNACLSYNKVEDRKSDSNTYGNNFLISIKLRFSWNADNLKFVLLLLFDIDIPHHTKDFGHILYSLWSFIRNFFCLVLLVQKMLMFEYIKHIIVHYLQQNLTKLVQLHTG